MNAKRVSNLPKADAQYPKMSKKLPFFRYVPGIQCTDPVPTLEESKPHANSWSMVWSLEASQFGASLDPPLSPPTCLKITKTGNYDQVVFLKIQDHAIHGER